MKQYYWHEAIFSSAQISSTFEKSDMYYYGLFLGFIQVQYVQLSSFCWFSLELALIFHHKQCCICFSFFNKMVTNADGWNIILGYYCFLKSAGAFFWLLEVEKYLKLGNIFQYFQYFFWNFLSFVKIQAYAYREMFEERWSLIHLSTVWSEFLNGIR